MYLYFDKNGVLQEVVNNKKPRAGDVDSNRIYAYIEGDLSADEVNIVIQRADGSLSNEVSIFDNKVIKTIPYDSKRDMKFFKDFQEYPFYFYDLTYDDVKYSGLAYATITIYVDNKAYAQGLITFNIERSIVKIDNFITQSQYQYLLLSYASRTLNAQTGADLDGFINERIDAHIQDLDGLKVSGVDTSANILAFPSDKGIYVATDTGHWYFWSMAQNKYIDGGVFQAVKLSESDREKLEKVVELSGYFRKSKNLIDSSTLIDGYTISDDGTVVSKDNWCYTNQYIEIKAGEHYRCSTGFYCAFYDEGKTFIGAGDKIIVPYTIITPSTAKYMRISILISKKSNLMLCLDNENEDYEPFGWVYLDGVKVDGADILNTQAFLYDYYKKGEVDAIINNVKNNIDLSNYYTKSEVDTIADNIKNNIDLSNYYTKAQVDAKVSSVYKFKGSVATYADLPDTDINIGDVYDVKDTGMNYGWTGEKWDELGAKYSFTLNQATATDLGGIKAEEKTSEYTEEVKIDSATGKLYFKPSNSYVLPQATETNLGGIKAQQKTAEETEEVKIDSATGKLYSKKHEKYVLPQASASNLGGVKAKAATAEDTQEVHIDEDGFLCTKKSSNEYVLPKASETTLGGIKAKPLVMEDIQEVHIGQDGMLYTKAGSEVVANPSLSGNEPGLTGLQVGDTKYKVPSGGGGGISLVSSLPVISKTEYDKHLLYLNGVELFYLADTPITEPTLTDLGNLLPSERTGTSATSIGTNVYIFGGLDSSNTAFSDILKFDTTNNTCTKVADMPNVRAITSAAAVGNNIYIFGGYSSVNTDILQFDTTNNTCTKVTDMPSGRTYTSAAAVGNNIYIFGGYSSGYLSSILKFDTTNNKCTKVADMPSGRRTTSAAVVGNNIYIFGGYDSSHTALSDILKFDTTNNTCTKVADMPSGRDFTSATSIGTNVYIFGGLDSSNTAFSDILKFDTTNNTCTKVADMPSRRSSTSAAAVGDNIYVFGGDHADVGQDVLKLALGNELKYRKLTSTEI